MTLENRPEPSDSASPNWWKWALSMPREAWIAERANEVETLAAELAAEAADMAARILSPDLLDAVISAAAAELAASWPAPDSARWPLWGGEAERVSPWPLRKQQYQPSDIGETIRLYRDALAHYAPALPEKTVDSWREVVIDSDPDGRRHVVTLAGLVALYRAERVELWRTRATFAAGEAYRTVRELGNAPNPGDAHYAAVDAALAGAKDGDKPDPLAAAASAEQGKRGQLAGELLAYAAKVAREVFKGEPPTSEPEARATVNTPHGPALRCDIAFADVLAGVGSVGTEKADDIRAVAAKRTADAMGEGVLPGMPPPAAGVLWSLWFEPNAHARWLRVVARALWADVWRPALEEDRERERRRGMYGGVSILPLAVNRAVTAVLDGKRTGEVRGEQLILFGSNSREVGRIELARIDIRIHARLVELLAEAPPSVDALFTYALLHGFWRWREMPRDGLGDGQLLIEGGKRGLAALLGCSEKDADYALTWGQHLTLSDIDMKGLWTWHGTYQSAAPGRPAVGMLTIQQALLPGSEQEHTGKGRYFAPWTEAPPLPADRSQHRAALHFWRLLGGQFAEIAASGKLLGGRAVIPVSVVEHLAKLAGESRWQERRDAWIKAGALDVDGDGWRYGPMYAAERKLLEGNQRVQKSAAKGGRTRAERAERGRDGKMKRKPT